MGIHVPRAQVIQQLQGLDVAEALSVADAAGYDLYDLTCSGCGDQVKCYAVERMQRVGHKDHDTSDVVADCRYRRCPKCQGRVYTAVETVAPVPVVEAPKV